MQMNSLSDLVGIVRQARELGYCLDIREEPTAYVAVAAPCTEPTGLRLAPEAELTRGSDRLVIALAALGILRETIRAGTPWSDRLHRHPNL
jgi:hypothetical protein